MAFVENTRFSENIRCEANTWTKNESLAIVNMKQSLIPKQFMEL
ncbi:MAG: hypothetical protein ACJATI_000019 [Halioglobus sp.]|jgi:hypothetical protein